MTDEHRALFEAALSDEPATEAAQSEPAPQEQPAPVETQPRDEHGRFAPKAQLGPEAPPAAPVQAAPQEQPPQQEDRGHIPAWRLKEEADARREAEKRAQEYEQRVREFEQRLAAIQAQQQPQQPPEAPDIFENPQGYTSHIQQTFEQRLREQELNFSLRLAKMQHKDFDEAYSAALQRGQMGDKATVAALVNSPDPGEAIVRWHRQQKLYETTGGDLDGYFAKRQEELLKDPAFLAKAVEAIKAQSANGQNGQRPAVQLPPSLSRVPSAAPAAESAGDMSDAALFANALR